MSTVTHLVVIITWVTEHKHRMSPLPFLGNPVIGTTGAVDHRLTSILEVTLSSGLNSLYEIFFFSADFMPNMGLELTPQD